MRVLGLILRTLFLAVVVAVTARVASPQNETFLSAYDTPTDLFRMVLGAAVCIFVTIQIFRYSRDPADMRKWVGIGVVAVPLAILCAVIVW
jgi:phosphoglycerol transferase MdoB-like AlkP superfamily enzyme